MVFTQYLTTIMDSIQDAIVLLGLEPANTYRILMTNAAFHNETGIKKNCIGKTIDEVIDKRSLGKLTKHYGKVAKVRKQFEYTAWYDLPAGRKFFEVKLIPIFNAVGECVQIVAILRNTTELHQLRETTREAAETLEQVAYNLRLE